MDSFEINKIIAAVLLVAFLVIGIDKISSVIFHVDKPKTPGYIIEIDQVASKTSIEEKIDIASLIAMGDITHGEKQFKKCKACHSIKQGGGNGGHNGLLSIDESIGNNYKRLRIGIGHPGVKEMVSSYVLEKFSKQEKEFINNKITLLTKNFSLIFENESLLLNKITN